MKLEVSNQILEPESGDYTCTVKELIEMLEKMPKELPVRTEDCDCFGPINSVEIYKQVVFLNRSK